MRTLKEIALMLIDFFGQIAGLLIVIVTVLVIWNVFMYIKNSEKSEGKPGTGFDRVLWSIIALAVLFSVFGLVVLIKQSLGIV